VRLWRPSLSCSPVPPEGPLCMSAVLSCTAFGCASNLVFFAKLCLPPGKWKQTGTGFRSKFWLNKHPCGIICASLTQFLICGAGYITNFLILYPWFGLRIEGIAMMALYNTFLFMASFSHWRTMTTDPGAVPRDAEPLPGLAAEFKRLGKAIPKCRRTGTFKPPRAHFDRALKRNVVRMDHHCPWVNNCVGIGNQKLFLLFLLYTALSCWLSMGLLFSVWVKCGVGAPRLKHISATSAAASSPRTIALEKSILPVCKISASGSTVVFQALLCLEALLFGLFTAGMLCDQISSICANQTKIDYLQGKKFGRKSSFISNLGEVMGDTEIWTEWLWPSKPCWREWESLYGYCLPVNSPQDKSDIEADLSAPKRRQSLATAVATKREKPQNQEQSNEQEFKHASIRPPPSL